jgi:hypothetical protein
VSPYWFIIAAVFIVIYADVFSGARVLEAGAGSGALSCWLLRAIGRKGSLGDAGAAGTWAAWRSGRTTA